MMPRAAEVTLAIAAGSAVGGVARFLLTAWAQGQSGSTFPTGTLVVNLVGCLALGFLMHLVSDTAALSPQGRALLTTGFCGGFTTFSTFAYETVALVEEGAWRRATLNAGLSLLGGLAAILVGAQLAKGLLALARAPGE